MVLLHGGPGLHDYMQDIVPMLADRFSVHRYDQRGGGRSARASPCDLATSIADLEALRAYWGHDRVRLVGHSFGACLALLYAFEHPEHIERMVLWCGIGITMGWQDEQRAAVEARLTSAELARLGEIRSILQTGAADPDSALDREGMRLRAISDLADRSNAGLLPDPVFAYPTNYEVNARQNADWVRLIDSGELDRRARTVTVATVVWQAEGDPRPEGPARALAEVLPSARFEILPKAGHLPWIERPNAVRTRLRELLG
ncbi:MAG TPA: alpha/beta hydrolase [Candidatus Limnocylindria bacterium]|nr:alpha/beta hydrolase [Candidatus Limnocylindria bacterium]